MTRIEIAGTPINIEDERAAAHLVTALQRVLAHEQRAFMLNVPTGDTRSLVQVSPNLSFVVSDFATPGELNDDWLDALEAGVELFGSMVYVDEASVPAVLEQYAKHQAEPETGD